MRRARSKSARAGQMCLVVLLLLAVLEMTARTASWLQHRDDPIDDRLAAEVYEGQEWAVNYFRDLHAIPMRWEPYTYWRRTPARTQWITTAPSTRATSRASSIAPEYVVLCFGGSAMWGTGVPDFATIPSQLAFLFPRVYFFNFGESGYVSTQEVIALVRALHRGSRPNLVIFYDGVNDLTAAYQGRPGDPQNEANRQGEFNLLQAERWPDRLRLVARDAAFSSALIRGIAALVARPAPAPPVDTSMIREALRVYAANMAIVLALGRAYGFEALFYWQPTVFDKSRLSPHEARQAAKSSGIEPWVRASRAIGPPADVVDLSGIFRDDPAPMFIDAWHVGEAGNAIIAERIARDVLATLEKSRR